MEKQATSKFMQGRLSVINDLIDYCEAQIKRKKEIPRVDDKPQSMIDAGIVNGLNKVLSQVRGYKGRIKKWEGANAAKVTPSGADQPGQETTVRRDDTQEDHEQLAENEQLLFNLVKEINEAIEGGSKSSAEWLLGTELIQKIATAVAMGPDPRWPK